LSHHSNRFYFNNQLLANDTTSITLILPPVLDTYPTTTLFAFIDTDILLSIGGGLVVERNVRIIKHQYKDRKAIP